MAISPILDLNEASDLQAALAPLKLQLKHEAVLLLLGSFEPALNSPMRSLCERVIAPVAFCANALVVDDCEPSGMAGLMGLAVQELDEAPSVLGIRVGQNDAGSAIPSGHAVMLRLTASLSALDKLRFGVLATLAVRPAPAESEPATSSSKKKKSSPTPKQEPDPDKEHGKPVSALPVIALLAGGGEAERLAVLRAIRHRWPVVIFAGAGGLGDSILEAIASTAPAPAAPIAATPTPAKDFSETAAPVPTPAVVVSIPTAPVPADRSHIDPDLREIVESDFVYKLQLDGNADELQRSLLDLIQKPTLTLTDAWGRFDDYDLAALEKQRVFRQVQMGTLVLGVFATLLAIASSITNPPGRSVLHGFRFLPQTHTVIHILLIITPIAISVLVGINSRFREGQKWLLLRSAAESIKSEIYRYRAGSGVYNDEDCGAGSPQSNLAGKITQLSSNLVRSEVNKTNLPMRHAQNPGRLTFLTPHEYLVCRTQDQIAYFASKTQSLYGKIRRMQVCILLAGAVGTFLAAINVDVWVALTTSIAGAIGAKLEMDQDEKILVQYNITLTGLRNVESWWKALTRWERKQKKSIDLLVDQTEKALAGESADWMQQMQAALDKFTVKENEPTGGAAASQKP